MPVASLGDEGSSCCVKLIAVEHICVVARRRRILLATSNVQQPCICVVAKRRQVLLAMLNVRQPLPVSLTHG